MWIFHYDNVIYVHVDQFPYFSVENGMEILLWNKLNFVLNAPVGPVQRVHIMMELNIDNLKKVVKDILDEWAGICHLYSIVHEFAQMYSGMISREMYSGLCDDQVVYPPTLTIWQLCVAAVNFTNHKHFFFNCLVTCKLTFVLKLLKL